MYILKYDYFSENAMRIISKFKDYYDTAMCHTFCNDSEAVYVRKENEIATLKKEFIPCSINTYFRYLSSFNQIPPIEINVTLIVFCGKIYHCIRAHQIINYYNNPNYSYYYYNITSDIEERIIEFYDLSKKQKSTASKYIKLIFKSIKDQLNEIKLTESIINELSIIHRSPYFKFDLSNNIRSSDRHMIINFNKLADYAFYKVFDANRTYQEIEMYFNSVLVNTENPPQITDNKVLTVAKGFDLKTSFRHPIK